MKSIFFQNLDQQNNFDQNEKKEAKSYYDYKQNYYSNKSKKIKDNQNYDVKKYLEDYKNLQQKFQQEKIDKVDTFQSIFENQIQLDQFEIEKQRQKYYDNFILNYKESEQQSQQDNNQSNEQESEQIPDNKFYKDDIQDVNEEEIDFQKIIDKNIKKQFKKEIQFVKQQIDDLEVMQNKQIVPKLTCTNQKILEKISPIIYNSYMVYFDEIFDLLIDDILIDEVIFLNENEEIQKEQQQEKQNYELNDQINSELQDQDLDPNVIEALQKIQMLLDN